MEYIQRPPLQARKWNETTKFRPFSDLAGFQTIPSSYGSIVSTNTGFPRKRELWGKVNVGSDFQLAKSDVSTTLFNYKSSVFGKNPPTDCNVGFTSFPGGITVSGTGGHSLGTVTAPSGLPSGAQALPTFAGIQSFGAEVVHRSNPSKPTFDLLYSLTELWRDPPISREALKSAVQFQTARHGIKSVSNSYLQTQFAILPTVSDAHKLFDTMRRSHDLLAKYHAGSGVTQHRKGPLREFTWSASPQRQTGSVATFNVVGLRGHDPSRAVLTTQQSGSLRQWYSTAWRYYVDNLDPLHSSISDYEHLFGAPSLATAWNLIPWTWLLDWFTNFGHIMNNLSYIGQDGSYMVYGYIMSEWKNTVENTFELPQIKTSYPGDPQTFVNCSVTGRVESKYCQRAWAYPFGFSATFPSLSTKQVAILGALGVALLL